MKGCYFSTTQIGDLRMRGASRRKGHAGEKGGYRSLPSWTEGGSVLFGLWGHP